MTEKSRFAYLQLLNSSKAGSKTGISDDEGVGSKRAEVVIQALNSVVSTRKCFFKL